MTETADDHFPAPPPPISQYKILIRDSAHLGVQDYGFYGNFRWLPLANLFELHSHQDSFKSQNKEKKAATHNNNRSTVFQLQLWLQPPLYSILSSTGIAPKPQQWCYLPHLNLSFFLIIIF
jgi:hypothetical protein